MCARPRTNPQFNIDVLPESLAAVGIGYHHLAALGGLRHRRKSAMPSPNTLWRNTSFRNYADYAATDAFRLGLDELRALNRDKCCVIMCAEAVWWALPSPNHHGLPTRDRNARGAYHGARQDRSGGVLVYSAAQEDAP